MVPAGSWALAFGLQRTVAYALLAIAGTRCPEQTNQGRLAAALAPLNAVVRCVNQIEVEARLGTRHDLVIVPTWMSCQRSMMERHPLTAGSMLMETEEVSPLVDVSEVAVHWMEVE